MSLPAKFLTRERVNPADTLRCPTCNGFLSFEYHDEWHRLFLWNAAVQADGQRKRLQEFEKDMAVQEKVKSRRKKYKFYGQGDPGLVLGI